jgi:hypothetical protein
MVDWSTDGREPPCSSMIDVPHSSSAASVAFFFWIFLQKEKERHRRSRLRIATMGTMTATAVTQVLLLCEGTDEEVCVGDSVPEGESSTLLTVNVLLGSDVIAAIPDIEE